MNREEMQQRARLFSEALVSEIKAEMGRQSMSSRALGRAIEESPQYVSTRLDGGNPRTGERVTLNARDISAIAAALNLSEVELIERAEEAMKRSEHKATVTDLSERRGTNVGSRGENSGPRQSDFARVADEITETDESGEEPDNI